MGESRDARDPRDTLRALNKEARAEFEGEEEHDSGGQEHAAPPPPPGAPRGDEGGPPGGREAAPELRVPRGGTGTGGGGNASRDEPPTGPSDRER